MSVAKNIEISSTSTKSFEDAINRGIERATRSLDNVTSAWIKEQKINLERGQAKGYQVIMIVTFVLDGSEMVEDEVRGGSSSKGSGSDKSGSGGRKRK